MKLNLGSGSDYREGWINADIRPAVDPDVVLHMDSPYLPFSEETFDYVLSDNVLEHSADQFKLLKELHRITKPGATLVFRGPHWNSAGAWADPTHTRPFTQETFNHYLVTDLFETVSVSCTQIRIGRILPEQIALRLADHLGQIVSEIEVIVERL